MSDDNRKKKSSDPFDYFSEMIKKIMGDVKMPNEFTDNMGVADDFIEKITSMIPDDKMDEESRDVIKKMMGFMQDSEPGTFFEIIKIGLADDREDSENIFGNILNGITGKETEIEKTDYSMEVFDRGDFYSSIIEVPSKLKDSEISVIYADPKLMIESVDYKKEFDMSEYSGKIEEVEKEGYNNGFLTLKMRKVRASD